MREKTLRVLITFHTTTDALTMERMCQAKGVPGRLIPVPGIITAGCGMCWSAPAQARSNLLDAVERFAIPKAGVYEMLL